HITDCDFFAIDHAIYVAAVNPVEGIYVNSNTIVACTYGVTWDGSGNGGGVHYLH
ncbi:unnamed protein product, partial [marine sediment metagenome]